MFDLPNLEDAGNEEDSEAKSCPEGEDFDWEEEAEGEDDFGLVDKRRADFEFVDNEDTWCEVANRVCGSREESDQIDREPQPGCSFWDSAESSDEELDEDGIYILDEYLDDSDEDGSEQEEENYENEERFADDEDFEEGFEDQQYEDQDKEENVADCEDDEFNDGFCGEPEESDEPETDPNEDPQSCQVSAQNLLQR